MNGEDFYPTHTKGKIIYGVLVYSVEGGDEWEIATFGEGKSALKYANGAAQLRANEGLDVAVVQMQIIEQYPGKEIKPEICAECGHSLKYRKTRRNSER